MITFNLIFITARYIFSIMTTLFEPKIAIPLTDISLWFEDTVKVITSFKIFLKWQ